MRQGVQLIVTIVLARILTPEDFGVVAMLALFTGMAGLFIDGGFSAALIQRQQTTHEDETTVFFFNLAMGLVMALSLCAAAGWIAGFFGQPVLQYLTYAMAFNLLLNSASSIHSTLLNKEMDFRRLAKVGAVSSLVSGVVAVYMAGEGFGIWSLAGQVVSSGAVSLVLLWWWHPWRPAWTFSFTSLHSLFRFGGYEVAAAATDIFSTNLHLILIGKMYSVGEAGLFERAQRTQQLPITLMMNVINRVAFSAYASISSEKERLARGLRQAQTITMFVNVPVLAGTIVLAQPLVLTLFGEQWLPCVPILQVLGLGGLLWPMHVLNLNILRAQGRSDLFLRITLLKKMFAITVTVVSAFFGIMAIAWAQVVITLFAYFVNTHYTGEFLGYGGRKQLGDQLANFIAAAPMSCAIYLTIETMQSQPLYELAAGVFAGGLVFWFTCRLLYAELLNECLYISGLRKRPGQP